MKFGISEQFATDAAVEEQGAEFSPVPGVTFLVRSREARSVRRALLALNQKQQPIQALGTEWTIERLDAAEIDVCVEVLAGWSGITDETGAAVPFSRDAARAFAEAVPTLRSAIVAFSTQRAAFKRGAANAIAGN